MQYTWHIRIVVILYQYPYGVYATKDNYRYKFITFIICCELFIIVSNEWKCFWIIFLLGGINYGKDSFKYWWYDVWNVSHMNDLMRNKFNVKKVTSSAKKGETVVISKEDLDMAQVEKEISEIGYKLVSHTSEPYEKKGFFSFGK